MPGQISPAPEATDRNFEARGLTRKSRGAADPLVAQIVAAGGRTASLRAQAAPQPRSGEIRLPNTAIT